jgi:hypothetical protein
VPLPGAPSIAHFAMGGMKPPPEAQPFCFCCFFVFVVALALACHSERSEEPPHLFLFFAFAFAFVFLLSLSAPQNSGTSPQRAEGPRPLAWGNAPGHNRLTIGGLMARAKCLIRNFNETSCRGLAPPKVSH